MSMDDDKKSYKLSIYLLKDEVKNFQDALKTRVAVAKIFKLKKEIEAEGEILIGITKSTPSGWRELLQGGTEEEIPDLDNSSNRALAFFKIEERIFVLTFGYGKHLLKEELIEHDFGLRTALNIVNADKLLSIDKANLDNLTLLTRTQASRKAKPEAFNIDVIRDLLRGVTGESSLDNANIGNIITGNEGVYIIPKTDFADIPKSLKEIKKAYESDNYKARFGWIDNLREEKDPILIEYLCSELVKDIQKKDNSKIHLAPPFLIDWTAYEGFSFTPKGKIETEFDIDTFFEAREHNLSHLDWDKLSALQLYIKYGDDEERQPFKIWRCLNYQTEKDKNIYVFALGKWYKVNKKYSDELIEFVSQIKESDSVFIECDKGMNEKSYNEKLAKSKTNYKLLDSDLVKSDLVRSEIEVCDVITQEGEFIHVKFRRSSATLSHLFAQGRISAQALRRDRSFKKNLRSKLATIGINRDLIPIENNQVDPSNYTITFALIETIDRSFVKSLPFFSLINFRLTAEDLMLLGYNVRVKKIRII